jgi:hypothetical protein
MEGEKKRNIKKIIIYCIIAVCLLTVIISVLRQCFDPSNVQKDPTVQSYDPFLYKSDVGYYTPEEGENIFDDKEYMEKNRYLAVEYQGTTMTYTENEIDTAPMSVQMLFDYFQAAINGDGAALNTFFTDYYFNNFGTPIAKYEDSFYQQKIYNIKVSLISGPTAITNKSGVITREIFEVSYYIMDNNGAFRPDLPDPSEGTIPVFFEILTEDGISKINQIFVYAE